MALVLMLVPGATIFHGRECTAIKPNKRPCSLLLRQFLSLCHLPATCKGCKAVCLVKFCDLISTV